MGSFRRLFPDSMDERSSFKTPISNVGADYRFGERHSRRFAVPKLLSDFCALQTCKNSLTDAAYQPGAEFGHEPIHWFAYGEFMRFFLRSTQRLLCLLILLTGMADASGQVKVTYYYTDPQGTVLATADEAGNVTASSDYRAYGEQALGTPEAAPGYTGHVNDPDTRLVYMQARYYDPEIGRFVQVDPKSPDAGHLENFGRYAYAQNNPTRYVDPDGKQSWCTPGNCGAESYLKASNNVAYFRENFDVVAEVKGAYGPGLELNYNLSQAHGELNLFPVAHGAELSIYAQPKTPIVVPIVDKPTTGKMAMSWGVGADVAAVVKLGLDVKYDPGGKFELTPKAGFGAGEFQQFAPSINLLEWQNSPEKESKGSNE